MWLLSERTATTEVTATQASVTATQTTPPTATTTWTPRSKDVADTGFRLQRNSAPSTGPEPAVKYGAVANERAP
jgi:hypothetical protein